MMAFDPLTFGFGICRLDTFAGSFPVGTRYVSRNQMQTVPQSIVPMHHINIGRPLVFSRPIAQCPQSILNKSAVVFGKKTSARPASFS
jgi:hypothetical protein